MVTINPGLVLGLTYRDPADTVSEQFQQMIDDGLVHKPIGRQRAQR